MNTIETTLTTQAVFSESGDKRFLLKKIWNKSLPKLTIIMLAPSSASGIALDSTTSLVLNNSDRLGFGSVSIVNLFATLGDFALSAAEDEDPENLEAITNACAGADVIIFAPGVGKNKLQAFQDRSKQVLEALRPFEKKLKCLTNSSGKARLLHPLCPAVRNWNLAELSVSELLSNSDIIDTKAVSRKKSKPLVTKKEASTGFVALP